MEAKISIKHQEDRTMHDFYVSNPKSLSSKEVELICREMGVSALLIEGKYYSGK